MNIFAGAQLIFYFHRIFRLSWLILFSLNNFLDIFNACNFLQILITFHLFLEYLASSQGFFLDRFAHRIIGGLCLLYFLNRLGGYEAAELLLATYLSEVLNAQDLLALGGLVGGGAHDGSCGRSTVAVELHQREALRSCGVVFYLLYPRPPCCIEHFLRFVNFKLFVSIRDQFLVVALLNNINPCRLHNILFVVNFMNNLAEPTVVGAEKGNCLRGLELRLGRT